MEYIEGVAVELKTHLSGFMVSAQQQLFTTSIQPYVVFFCQQMDALPLLTPNVGSGEDRPSTKDKSSTTVLTQEAAQKLLESERDSLKTERHMYQMKCLAAEDMLEAVKSDRQSLEVLAQLYNYVLCYHRQQIYIVEIKSKARQLIK